MKVKVINIILQQLESRPAISLPSPQGLQSLFLCLCVNLQFASAHNCHGGHFMSLAPHMAKDGKYRKETPSLFFSIVQVNLRVNEKRIIQERLSSVNLITWRLLIKYYIISVICNLPSWNEIRSCRLILGQ